MNFLSSLFVYTFLIVMAIACIYDEGAKIRDNL